VIFEPCNCPVNDQPAVSALVYCGKPACKFFISIAPSGIDAGVPHLHPRCDEHWRGTALPTSPNVTEVSEEEFAVWRVMLA